MGLLSPLLLLLGTLAAVPLLLHLLQRHQGPRMTFPALRYLRRAEKESARRIRVRQLLLMMLRVAAVLLIALAAARPFVRADGVGHAPTAVVIILDNSMSSAAVVGEARVLDDLKARALEVLEVAGPDDAFWLLRAGNAGEPALPGDAATTALRVRETTPSASQADLAAAVRHAATLLAAGADGRAAEIHLLSDLQAAAFAASVPADGSTPPLVVWHAGADAPANRAVGALEVGGGLAPLAGAATTVAAMVEGDGEDAVSTRLFIEDRLVAAAMARPGSAAVLALPPQPAGIVTGHVEIDADALRMDDRRYFAVRVLPPPAVAVAGSAPFVEDALAVLEDAGRVRRAAAPEADVVFQPRAAGAAAAGATLVVLPPEDPAELAAVNQRLAAAGVPWQYRPPLQGEARFAPADDDPLLRALEPARLTLAYPLEPAGAGADDQVLLRLSDGTPWAARGARRIGGRYVVLASPLTAEASTLPVSAAMLPLLDRILGAWAAAQPPRRDMAPGAEVALPEGATHVVRPDGTREAVSAASHPLGSDAGIYRVIGSDGVIAAFAVNPVTAPLDRLSPDALRQRLPGWTAHVATSAPAWRRAVFRERLGHEVWRPLVAGLLFLLIVELIVAAAGRVSRTAPAAASPEVGTG